MHKKIGTISAIGLGLLAAACAGTGPGTSGQPQGSLRPLPSLSLPSIAFPSLDVPSIAIPSVDVAPDNDLEALFPDTVNGQPLQVTSASGEGVLTQFATNSPDEFRSFISDLGANMDQVSAAFSFSLFPGATATDLTGLTLAAIRVQGVESTRTLAGLAEITKDEVSNAQIGTATIGGKSVTSIANPEDEEENVYLYAYSDIVFLGGGTPQHVEEAFSQLP
jgi:hypothetical protein